MFTKLRLPHAADTDPSGLGPSCGHMVHVWVRVFVRGSAFQVGLNGTGSRVFSGQWHILVAPSHRLGFLGFLVGLVGVSISAQPRYVGERWHIPTLA